MSWSQESNLNDEWETPCPQGSSSIPGEIIPGYMIPSCGGTDYESAIPSLWVEET